MIRQINYLDSPGAMFETPTDAAVSLMRDVIRFGASGGWCGEERDLAALNRIVGFYNVECVSEGTGYYRLKEEKK